MKKRQYLSFFVLKRPWQPGELIMTAGHAKSGTQLFWFFQIFRTIPKIRNNPKDNHQPYFWVLFTLLIITHQGWIQPWSRLDQQKSLYQKKIWPDPTCIDWKDNYIIGKRRFQWFSWYQWIRQCDQKNFSRISKSFFCFFVCKHWTRAKYVSKYLQVLHLVSFLFRQKLSNSGGKVE